jgi:phage terminase small subunit
MTGVKKIVNYKPPRAQKTFCEKWKLFLPQIVNRDNFTESHLSQLEILCSLYEEFENLTDAIDREGYTYESVTNAGGVIIKARPEVAQLNTCRTQIAIYTRMLGLTLVKNMVPTGNNSDKELWE